MDRLLSRLPAADQRRVGEAFHHVVINHFPHIREKGLYREEPVTNVLCSIYRGDFYGLLLHLGALYPNLRIHTEYNGFTTPHDYDGREIVVKIIDEEFINRLYNQYLTRRQ